MKTRYICCTSHEQRNWSIGIVSDMPAKKKPEKTLTPSNKALKTDEYRAEDNRGAFSRCCPFDDDFLRGNNDSFHDDDDFVQTEQAEVSDATQSNFSPDPVISRCQESSIHFSIPICIQTALQPMATLNDFSYFQLVEAITIGGFLSYTLERAPTMMVFDFRSEHAAMFDSKPVVTTVELHKYMKDVHAELLEKRRSFLSKSAVVPRLERFLNQLGSTPMERSVYEFALVYQHSYALGEYQHEIFRMRSSYSIGREGMGRPVSCFQIATVLKLSPIDVMAAFSPKARVTKVQS